MNSTLYSPTITATQLTPSEENTYDLDTCITLAWLELVAVDADSLTGDDWLALCDDIDTGELYRDWFIWHDREVSGEWEAYDPFSDRRLVAPDLKHLKLTIDLIEDSRTTDRPMAG